MVEPPCGLVGFYTENGEPRSAALAVGAGSNVFIYKNMRPHFKFCLPHLDAHPKEREVKRLKLLGMCKYSEIGIIHNYLNINSSIRNMFKKKQKN